MPSAQHSNAELHALVSVNWSERIRASILLKRLGFAICLFLFSLLVCLLPSLFAPAVSVGRGLSFIIGGMLGIASAQKSLSFAAFSPKMILSVSMLGAILGVIALPLLIHCLPVLAGNCLKLALTVLTASLFGTIGLNLFAIVLAKAWQTPDTPLDNVDDVITARYAYNIFEFDNSHAARHWRTIGLSNSRNAPLAVPFIRTPSPLNLREFSASATTNENNQTNLAAAATQLFFRSPTSATLSPRNANDKLQLVDREIHLALTPP